MPGTVDQSALTIVGDKAVTVELRHEDDMPNPSEDYDGVGMIHSLSRRHINSIDIHQARALLPDPDNIPLSYYEHGLSLWYVASEYKGIIPDRQWDNVDFAGVWVPDASVLECAGPLHENLKRGTPERRAWMSKQAQSACEIYSQWINGDIYGCIINVYDIIRDDDGDVIEDPASYINQSAEAEAPLWGLYGWDYAISEAAYEARRLLDT
jgi:hypothetical protein